MAASNIILPSDAANTGKKLQTWDNTVSGADVYAEAVVLVDSTGTEKGTGTNPVRIDPTGTTVQPVSIASPVGQTVSASSIPVVLASDQSVISENLSQWGGTAVTAPPASGVPAVGTEVAPVVKPIARKSTEVSTTTPLAANGVFTSAWIDTQQTGDHFVSVEYTSNVAGASLVIQETDNTSDAAFRSVASHSTPSGGTRFTRRAAIGGRYWQVVYTNGATLQTSFELTATGSSVPCLPVGISSNNGQATLQMGAVAAVNGDIVAPLITIITTSGGVANSGADNIIDLTNSAGALGKLGTVQFAVTDGTAGGQQAAIRTPNVFKTASVSATASGNTAVWTPTSGKKFRLMRFQITGSNLAATAATVLTISFQDATTGINIGTYDVLLPAVANLQYGITAVSAWVDLGNGYLSTTANNVLNANISATVTGATGTFRVNACGTEE